MKSKLKQTVLVTTWLVGSAAAMADAPGPRYTLTTIEDAAYGAEILDGNYAQAIKKIAARRASPLSDARDRFLRSTNLCVAHTKLGEFEDAQAACDAAVNAAADSKEFRAFVKRRYLSLALSNRGVLYAVMGNDAQARQDFVDAIEVSDRLAAAKTNLGRLEASSA